MGQKVQNLKEITFNKRFGNLIGRCFECPTFFIAKRVFHAKSITANAHLAHS